VKATENTNESPWSEVWSFTTGIQSLDAPDLISPENGANNVSINPSFDWNDVIGATGYTMQISIDNSFLSGVSTFNLTNSNHTISGLMYDNTFYWRVKATENNNESPWSTVWSFTTEIQTLDAPILISPENNAIDIDSLSVEFEWNEVSDANTYTIEISPDESFTDLFYTETTANLSITKGDFSCGTVYYWRVNATNSSITSNWSEIRQFTIADCVGVETLFEKEILVYPNPSNDIIMINHSFHSIEKIELIDISGKITPCAYRFGISDITIYISNIPEGLYQLRLLTNNRYYNFKIIKKSK
jgi:hypothetical protein